MVIHDQRHTNASKQTTLLDGNDIGTPKWGVRGRGLNRSIHEGLNDTSNVKVHLRTRMEIYICKNKQTCTCTLYNDV